MCVCVVMYVSGCLCVIKFSQSLNLLLITYANINNSLNRLN